MPLKNKIKAFFANKSIMKYLKNSSWMLAAYSLKIISAIFVGIYVARYLGPQDFGVLSYALAVMSIFTAISRLGMDSILVRDVAAYPCRGSAYVSTAFALMSAASVIGFVLLAVITYYFEPQKEVQWAVWLVGFGLIFQASLVVDFNFQGQVKSKYSSIAKSIALAVSSIIKVYLVIIQADFIYIAISYGLDYILTALALYVMHAYKRQPSFIKGFDRSLVWPLLKSAWPMVLAAVATILYMRIDQIMIKNMLGLHELGLYAAATKIYEGWVIIPYVLSISLLPAIVKLRSTSPESYEINMARLFSILFWVNVFVALLATFFGEWIVSVTFGDAYMDSHTVLSLVMWAAAFNAIGSVTARYLTVEKMEKKIAWRTFIGVFVNIGLNVILIPKYGIEGAAVSTLITLFIINYGINYFDSDLNQLIQINNRAFLLKFKTQKKIDKGFLKR